MYLFALQLYKFDGKKVQLAQLILVSRTACLTQLLDPDVNLVLNDQTLDTGLNPTLRHGILCNVNMHTCNSPSPCAPVLPLVVFLGLNCTSPIVWLPRCTEMYITIMLYAATFGLVVCLAPVF